MAELTPKQEKFCIKYVDTGNRMEAYKYAYNCIKSKPATISNNAYMLLQKSEIVARIKEIESNIQDTILWTKKQMISQLQKIVLDDNSSNTEKIQAIKQASNMLNYEKQEEQKQEPPAINITFTTDNN